MSATPTSTFVIVGTGLAGAKAAETLRAEGFDGRLLLLGEEAERPDERSPLSKAYLRGEADRDSLYVHPEGFYAAHDIELRPSTPVGAIDPGSRQLELVSGERISYERLLLATGAAPRRLPLPGAELDCVRYLRTRVAGLRGNGRVEAVVTEDGRTIDCDLVLIGAGAVPRTELAEAAGLPVRNGILVNEQLEAVGAAGVYAVGDVAAAWHPRYQTYLHVEHWANALNQGPAAARNMLGRSLPYARLPYFYSDQYDLAMEYSGLAASWDRVVVRGDLAARTFIAFWLKDQRVVAGMNANVWDVTESIQALIRSGRPVDPARLADLDIPLDQVASDLVTTSTRCVPRPPRPTREVMT
jgi:3-phenylpropionate/trans-cinnamate dioxygenase ferredoxin reductase component